MAARRAGFAAALLCALSLGALPAPAARAGDAIPGDGKDVVLLARGGVLRCEVGAEADGRVELVFPGGVVRVPKAEILEIRRRADFDPAPRDDEDRRHLADGLVRWGGQWISPARRDDLLKKDRERQDRLREEFGSDLTWDQRWKRNAKHFAIEADISRRGVDFYEEQLEGFYDYFTSAFKVSLKRRIPVYIFKSRAEFRAFKRKDTGSDSESVVGYFTPVEGREHLVLFDWQGNRAETVRVLLHECTHLLFYLARPALRLPTMINEGLAEYYGACRVSKGRIVRGGIQDDRLVDLRAMKEKGSLLGLDVLLAHGHPDRSALDYAAFTPEDYAQAWAFVHMLFHGADGKYLSRFQAYLNAHWSLKPSDAIPGSTKDGLAMRYRDDSALLLRSLRVKDFAALQEEYVAYVDGLSFEGAAARTAMAYHYLSTDRDPVRAEAAMKEALERCGDDPEVLSEIVRLCSLMEGHEAEAADLLRRTLDLDPLNLDLRWELTGWFPDSGLEIPHLRLCADMGPGTPVGLDAVAWLALRGGDPARWFDTGFGSGADIEGMKARLAGAGAIPPAECGTMAAALLRAQEFGPALEAARRAAAGLPGDADLQALRARAAACAGDPAEFREALEAVRAVAGGAGGAKGAPAEAAVAREGARVLVEAASCAVAAGRAAEARKVLDAWYAARGTGPALEAEWLLHVGLAVRTKDAPVFLGRARAALLELKGSSRLTSLLVEGIDAGLGEVPDPDEAPDGGDGPGGGR